MKTLLITSFNKSLNDYSLPNNIQVYEWSEILMKTATHFDEYAIKLYHDLESIQPDTIIADESTGLILLLAASLFEVKADIKLINTSLNGQLVDHPTLNKTFIDVLKTPDLESFLNDDLAFTLYQSNEEMSLKNFFKNALVINEKLIDLNIISQKM